MESNTSGESIRDRANELTHKSSVILSMIGIGLGLSVLEILTMFVPVASNVALALSVASMVISTGGLALSIRRDRLGLPIAVGGVALSAVACVLAMYAGYIARSDMSNSNMTDSELSFTEVKPGSSRSTSTSESEVLSADSDAVPWSPSETSSARNLDVSAWPVGTTDDGRSRMRVRVTNDGDSDFDVSASDFVSANDKPVFAASEHGLPSVTIHPGDSVEGEIVVDGDGSSLTYVRDKDNPVTVNVVESDPNISRENSSDSTSSSSSNSSISSDNSADNTEVSSSEPSVTSSDDGESTISIPSDSSSDSSSSGSTSSVDPYVSDGDVAEGQVESTDDVSSLPAHVTIPDSAVDRGDGVLVGVLGSRMDVDMAGTECTVVRAVMANTTDSIVNFVMSDWSADGTRPTQLIFSSRLGYGRIAANAAVEMEIWIPGNHSSVSYGSVATWPF